MAANVVHEAGARVAGGARAIQLHRRVGCTADRRVVAPHHRIVGAVLRRRRGWMGRKQQKHEGADMGSALCSAVEEGRGKREREPPLHCRERCTAASRCETCTKAYKTRGAGATPLTRDVEARSHVVGAAGAGRVGRLDADGNHGAWQGARQVGRGHAVHLVHHHSSGVAGITAARQLHRVTSCPTDRHVGAGDAGRGRARWRAAPRCGGRT